MEHKFEVGDYVNICVEAIITDVDEETGYYDVDYNDNAFEFDELELMADDLEDYTT